MDGKDVLKIAAALSVIMIAGWLVAVGVSTSRAQGEDPGNGSGVTAVVSWTTVSYTEAGDFIPADDMLYSVVELNSGLVVCENIVATQCDIQIGYGSCAIVAAKAFQPSTGLESEYSNTVEKCVNPIVVAPTPPLIPSALKIQL